MMLILTTLACSLFDRPASALADAHAAIRDGDVATLERRVDLETVVPQAFQGCTRITLLEDWAERAAAPNQGLRELGRTLGRGLLSSAVESAGPELVDDVRAGLGTKTLADVCPAIQAGDVGRVSTEVDGARATAQLPIVAWGVEASVVATLTQGEDGWQVVGLDFDPAIATIKAGLESPTK